MLPQASGTRSCFAASGAKRGAYRFSTSDKYVVNVPDGVDVRVSVGVGVGVALAVAVGVRVGVGVDVDVPVGVDVRVGAEYQAQNCATGARKVRTARANPRLRCPA